MTITSTTRHRITPILAMAAFVGLTALAGCGGAASTPASGTPAAPAAAAVDGSNIGLAEFKLSNVPTTLPAGKSDLTITNNGSVDHELLIFKSDLAPAAYPADADGKILEEGAGINKVSDGDNVTAGQTQKRTVDLAAGTYLFVCNLPGHFKSGMSQVVTVK